MAERCVAFRSVPPQELGFSPAWSYRQGHARVRAEKAAQDLILQHLLSPEVGSYCSMPCLSCGCGQEHLAIFAKSGLLGSNRGKELVHHAMVSLGPLQPQPPLFFSPPCDINLQKQKEAADR